MNLLLTKNSSFSYFMVSREKPALTYFLCVYQSTPHSPLLSHFSGTPFLISVPHSRGCLERRKLLGKLMCDLTAASEELEFGPRDFLHSVPFLLSREQVHWTPFILCSHFCVSVLESRAKFLNRLM